MTLLFPEDIVSASKRLLETCRIKRIRLVTAESCTGGLIGASLTEIANSSDVVEGGYITYSNHSKIALLNVSKETLSLHGAVSSETAEQMSKGAIYNHDKEFFDDYSYIAVSVTGVAGPGGGSKEKPVGTVWIGCASVHGGNYICSTKKFLFSGSRTDIRLQTVDAALGILKYRAEEL